MLLTGDTVLGMGTSVIMHPDGHLGSYLSSLDRLSRLVASDEVALILPGHGPVVSDPVGWLAFYRRHREERLDQVRAALAAGDRTAAEVVARVYATSTGRSGPRRNVRWQPSSSSWRQPARRDLIGIAQGVHRLRRHL